MHLFIKFSVFSYLFYLVYINIFLIKKFLNKLIIQLPNINLKITTENNIFCFLKKIRVNIVYAYKSFLYTVQFEN